MSTDDVFRSAEVVKLVTEGLGGQMISAPFPESNVKMVAFFDPDGFKTVSTYCFLVHYIKSKNMAGTYIIIRIDLRK